MAKSKLEKMQDLLEQIESLKTEAAEEIEAQALKHIEALRDLRKQYLDATDGSEMKSLQTFARSIGGSTVATSSSPRKSSGKRMSAEQAQEAILECLKGLKKGEGMAALDLAEATGISLNTLRQTRLNEMVEAGQIAIVGKDGRANLYAKA